MAGIVGGANLALCVNRQVNSEFRHVGATRFLTTDCTLSTATKERTYVFPLRVVEAEHSLLRGGSSRSNLCPAFLAKLAAGLGIRPPTATNESLNGLTTEDIFVYIYAILHSPDYRRRYADFLKTDFPRIPLTGSLELFRALSRFSGKLLALHLLESPKLDKPVSTYIGSANPEIEKVSHASDTVWLDKAQTRGFRGVPEAVWKFQIGGYQVCDKWLKDRRGRTLSKDDIAHYQKIVVALSETIRLMKEIDEVIEEHGGWPGAFQTEPSADPSVEADGERVVRLRPATEEAPTQFEQGSIALIGAAEPSAPQRVAGSSRGTKVAERVEYTEAIDGEDLVCLVRQLFSDGADRERDRAIAEMARTLGFDRTGSQIREELDNAIRTAVRRQIIANVGGTLRLWARSVEQYERAFLKEQFLASLVGRQWTERDEAIRAFARWLGFRLAAILWQRSSANWRSLKIAVAGSSRK
jgi:hypothetical protein